MTDSGAQLLGPVAGDVHRAEPVLVDVVEGWGTEQRKRAKSYLLAFSTRPLSQWTYAVVTVCKMLAWA